MIIHKCGFHLGHHNSGRMIDIQKSHSSIQESILILIGNGFEIYLGQIAAKSGKQIGDTISIAS
jgi:hypothetical protein